MIFGLPGVNPGTFAEHHGNLPRSDITDQKLLGRSDPKVAGKSTTNQNWHPVLQRLYRRNMDSI
jgi:hypothetical protein